MSAGPGIVVVGAGECGARAVFELRSAGWGGPITLVGAEDARPYERPPLSKAVLTGAAEPAPVCDEATLRDADVEFVPGVAAVDIYRESHELVLAVAGGSTTSGCCWPPGPLLGGCRGSTAGTTSGAWPTHSHCGIGCDPAPGSA
jgi:hypothetical protein